MTTSWSRVRRSAFVLGAIVAFYPFVCAMSEGEAKAQTGSAANHSRAQQARIEPWSEQLFAQVKKEYGAEAEARFRMIHDTALANLSRPVREQLEIVNATFNQLSWVSDRELWGREDYWAAPFEIIAKAGGDCEDMAIAKYVMLKMMGVPAHNLYLGYARLKTRNEAHMVLVWANDARNDVRILDNFDPEVKPAKARMDLQIVYLNDAEGRVILIDDNGKTRRIKSELGPRKMEKLEELKKKIVETRLKYQAYNEGRPLFPEAR